MSGEQGVKGCGYDFAILGLWTGFYFFEVRSKPILILRWHKWGSFLLPLAISHDLCYSRLPKQKRLKPSNLEGVIFSQTQWITGGKGRNIKYNYNANGLPEELLILSGATEATSENIIRLNKAGIGFSTDYGATYTTAWTIDGQFSASFITAGQMSAARITTGILQDENGVYPFFVDDSGALYAVSVTLVDASVFGTITTENGYYKAMLDSGYLRMYYDSTLYAQFGSTVWTANTQKRGCGVYASSGASYIFFGQEGSGGSYVSSYIINYNPDSTEGEIGYGERHLFYGTARFTDGVVMGSTLSLLGAETASASVTITAGLCFAVAHAYFAMRTR